LRRCHCARCLLDTAKHININTRVPTAYCHPTPRAPTYAALASRGDGRHAAARQPLRHLVAARPRQLPHRDPAAQRRRGGMAKRDASISHAERRLRCRRRVERPGADGGEVAAAFTLEIRGYRRCAPRTRLEYVVWTHAAQRLTRWQKLIAHRSGQAPGESAVQGNSRGGTDRIRCRPHVTSTRGTVTPAAPCTGPRWASQTGLRCDPMATRAATRPLQQTR
jgi:hypothetical protein